MVAGRFLVGNTKWVGRAAGNRPRQSFRQLSAVSLSGITRPSPPRVLLFPTLSSSFTERYGLHGTKGVFGGVVKAYDHDPGTPIAGWKSSWTSCRAVAKLSCRWHDLRHTFISRMGENNVADQTLLALAGQLSRRVLERYSHARNESKRAAVKLLDLPAGPNDSPQIPPQQAAKKQESLS
jgi:hypothetical protein